MASTRGIKGYFDFSKGVITEGSKLTYSENSLLDSLNVSFTPGKPLSKRLGMLVNSNVDLVDADPVSGLNGYTGAWYWEAPGGYSDRGTLVFGIGNEIIGISVNGALENAFQIDLDDVVQESFGAPPGGQYFQVEETSFTAISNKLYVVCYGEDRGNAASRIVVVEFNNMATAGFSNYDASVLEIQYRDFGDASTLDLGEEMHPDSNPDQYGAIVYDLFNRGFPHVTGPYAQSKFRIMDSSRGEYPYGGRDPLGYYRSRIGRYPTKGTIFALGLANYPELVNDTPRQDKVWDVDPYRTQNINFGSAATGHVILSAYNPRRWQTAMRLMNRPDDLSQVDTTPDPEPEIFTAAATWYGRACFGTSSGKVFMSQLYKDSRNNIAGKCYQEQDPTDSEFNELLATDGTVIDIGGAGAVIGMAPLGNSLVIMTNQGVWQLQGSSESYSIQAVSVSKLLSDSCTERNSIISFPGGIAFFADSAIYVVQRDPTVGTLSATAVSDDTIKSLYIDRYASGVSCAAFDYKNKRVEWIYPDGKILQFDVRTGAFFPQKIEGTDDQLRFAHRTPRLYQVPQEENVVSYDPITEETDFVESLGEQVTTTTTTVAATPDTGLVYYKLDFQPSLRPSFTRSSLSDETMVDYDTEEYRAYAEAGYDTFSDPTSNKEIDTLFAWFEITEDGIVGTPGGGYELENQSACDLSVKWEWSTSGASNRWYNAGNIYRLPVEYIVDDNDLTLDFGYSVAHATRGIPGAGKSVVFRFDDQPGKHMRLLGWAVSAANEVNP